MRILPVFILYLLLTHQLLGQNYIEYQKILNRVDEDVLSKNYTLAIYRLDSVYNNYKFIYAKHCIKALQICISANDSLNANKWLVKCFNQGIPLWMIKTNDITNQSLNYFTTQNTLKNYTSLHLNYLKSIDNQLSNTIDSLLFIDQKYTQKVNNGFILFRFSIYLLQWHVNNKKQLHILQQIIKTKGFPDEKLIGLAFIDDSVTFKNHFIFNGPSEIRNAKVQIMLQHCFSTYHKYDLKFKDLLYTNLEQGNLPAFQYAIISDFMCKNKKTYMNYKYHVRNNLLEENYIDIVNKNRNLIGLTTIAEAKRNTLIERERRKNKKANSEIMLEY